MVVDTGLVVYLSILRFVIGFGNQAIKNHGNCLRL